MAVCYRLGKNIKGIHYTLFAYLMLLPNHVQATQLPWETWKKSNELSVAYRPSQHIGFIEIKAQAKLESTLAGFIYFIEDIKNTPNWLYNTQSTVIINQISESESIFVTRFKSSWPIAKREVVVHSKYWQNEDLSLEILVTDASSAIEKTKSIIRMQVFSSHWKVVPIQSGEVFITYRFVIDPKGNIPKWLSKSLTLNGIWTSLNSLKEQLPLSIWQQQAKANIQEISKG